MNYHTRTPGIDTKQAGKLGIRVILSYITQLGSVVRSLHTDEDVPVSISGFIIGFFSSGKLLLGIRGLVSAL